MARANYRILRGRWAVEWSVTGTMTPNEKGGFDVDLKAISASTPRAKSGPKLVAVPDVDYEDRIARAREELGAVLGGLAFEMVNVMAAQNKTKTVSSRRALVEVYDPLVKARKTLDDEALVHGMQQALGRDPAIPNVNWAKKAATSYNESANTLAPSAPSVSASKYDILGGGPK